MLAAATVPRSIDGNILTCRAGAGCTSETIDGRVYKVLRTTQITVRVSLASEGQYTRADVSIRNNSPMQLNVLPGDFRVEVLTPKARTFEAVTPETVLAAPPELGEKAKKHKKEKRSSAMLAPPPLPAKPLPDLRAAALNPQQSVEGRVFFASDRKTETLNLVLPISGAVFEFPYQLK